MSSTWEVKSAIVEVLTSKGISSGQDAQERRECEERFERGTGYGEFE